MANKFYFAKGHFKKEKMSALRKFAERFIRFSGLGNPEDEQVEEQQSDEAFFEDDENSMWKQRMNSPERSPNRKRVALSNPIEEENNQRVTSASPSSYQRRSLYNQQKNQQDTRKKSDLDQIDSAFKQRRNKVDRILNSNRGKVYRKNDRNMMSSSLAFLYENEILTDLTIIVGEDSKEEIKAHKAVLVCFLKNCAV